MEIVFSVILITDEGSHKKPNVNFMDMKLIEIDNVGNADKIKHLKIT